MLSMREMAEWIKKRLKGLSEEEMVFVLEYGMSTGDRELTGNLIEEIKSKDRDFETIKKRYLAIAEKKPLWVETAESLIASLEMLRIEKEEIPMRTIKPMKSIKPIKITKNNKDNKAYKTQESNP